MGSVHPPDELIDEILAIACITTFNIMVPLLLQSTQRCLELEWPQEVVCLLEVGSNSQYLVDEIFNTDNSMLPQSLEVHETKFPKWPAQGNSLLVQFPITSLVDQLSDTFQVWITENRKSHGLKMALKLSCYQSTCSSYSFEYSLALLKINFLFSALFFFAALSSCFFASAHSSLLFCFFNTDSGTDINSKRDCYLNSLAVVITTEFCLTILE
nr:Rpl7bp [Ipomoea batatas]GMD89310.1 Rpl7bp [Ipomoea batatas]